MLIVCDTLKLHYNQAIYELVLAEVSSNHLASFSLFGRLRSIHQSITAFVIAFYSKSLLTTEVIDLLVNSSTKRLTVMLMDRSTD